MNSCDRTPPSSARPCAVDLVAGLLVGTQPERGDMQLEPIIEAILSQYKLDPQGLHGIQHWQRVMDNGLRLAEATGADTTVITLFALFHDACRISEFKDSEHGARGAALAAKLRGKVFSCSDAQMELLVRACSRHTGGTLNDDPSTTVLACWDADRLDLGRVGKIVDVDKLCTEAAKIQHLEINESAE